MECTRHPHGKGASLVAQRVKSLPAMQETRVRSLGQEDPLEKEMSPLDVSKGCEALCQEVVEDYGFL